MTTTKTQEMKAKAAKEVAKAQRIEKDNKAKEVKYRNIINEKAKAEGHISEQDMEDMFDHYESLRIDNAKDTL